MIPIPTTLRSASRALRAAPLVSLVAILSLALGIGANTAIFSIVDALMLRSLPVQHADRLGVITDDGGRGSWTNPIWEAVRARSELFDGAFAAGRVRFNGAARGTVDPVDGLFTSADYFSTLGVTMARGRGFTDADDVRGGGPDGPVAVISHAFWQQRFGASEDAVGQTLTLSGVAFTVIGITPAGFFGHEVGRTFDVAVPLGTEPLVHGAESMLDRRSTWWMSIFVRLQPGQSVEQATTRLRTVQAQLREETMPQDWRAEDLERYLATPLSVDPAASGISSLRRRYERPLIALMAVVAFTLLIACGNIANLMLARAASRRHEFAVRTALGAPRWRLVKQMLAENVLLSLLGAGLGVVLALWASRVILNQIGTSSSRVFLDVGLDWRMLGFTAVVAIGTTMLFGLTPALLASRVAPMEAMKQHASGRGGSGRGVGLAGSLVLTQVALSMLLLVAAGLFVRTFTSLSQVELGFVPDQVLVVNVGAQGTDVAADARAALYERVRDAALSVPAVSAAGVSVLVPVSGSQWNSDVEFPGRPELPESERIVNMNYVSPGWFGMMGTPVLAGRDFDAREQAGAAKSVMVNRAFAEKYFDGENPVGQTILYPGFGDDAPEPAQIVGLVADAVYIDLREAISPTMYWAMSQMDAAPSAVVLSVRTDNSNTAAVTRDLTQAIGAVHRDLSLSFRPMNDYIAASLSQERLIAMMAGFFGVLALLLAALGLYGITAYAVSRRQLELGIRMALGATPSSVVRLVMSRTGALVVGGIVAGGLVSWWASRFVSSLLFGLQPTDPFTIAVAMLVLATVALVAGWLPARRAARVDPALVMREG